MLGGRAAIAVRWPCSTRLQSQGIRCALVTRPAYRAFSVSLSRCDVVTTTKKPGKPKKHVGEVSRTVKRAVKREAKTASTGAAGKKVAKKATAAKKKAPATKARAKAPKKIAVALTEEEKAAKLEAKKAKTLRERITAMKKIALDPPTRLSNTFAFFVANKRKGEKHGIGKGAQESRAAFTAMTKNVVEQWKTLTPAEREQHNHEFNIYSEKIRADYKSWVESHTPAEIREANNARKWLRRHTKNSRWAQIADERKPSHPSTSYLQFSVNRRASGDFAGIPIAESGNLLAQEWKTLSESEKAKYQKLAQEDIERYKREFTETYGHAPGPTSRKTAAA